MAQWLITDEHYKNAPREDTGMITYSDSQCSVALAVPWVGLRCVIVVFPDHTHFLFSISIATSISFPTGMIDKLERGQSTTLQNQDQSYKQKQCTNNNKNNALGLTSNAAIEGSGYLYLAKSTFSILLLKFNNCSALNGASYFAQYTITEQRNNQIKLKVAVIEQRKLLVIYREPEPVGHKSWATVGPVKHQRQALGKKQVLLNLN